MGNMRILEAVCQKCGETFNPHPSGERVTPEDLVHGQNNDQTEVCGGQGIITGEWTT